MEDLPPPLSGYQQLWKNSPGLGRKFFPEISQQFVFFHFMQPAKGGAVRQIIQAPDSLFVGRCRRFKELDHASPIFPGG